MKKSSCKREFDFEASYEEEEESAAQPDKKRRLRADQVKALERSFEAENKLEPERKVQLAIELGLDPRQVAIWFQNRRARWKTKQLESDYVSLQSAYNELKRNCDAVKRHNETLVQQIGEMKARMLAKGDAMSGKEEMVDRDGDFGFCLKNYDTPVYGNLNVVSSDSAASGVQSADENGTPNGVVSSYEMLGNEDDQSLAIWPSAATYSFLADEELPAPVFNWYCPDPWT